MPLLNQRRRRRGGAQRNRAKPARPQGARLPTHARTAGEAQQHTEQNAASLTGNRPSLARDSPLASEDGRGGDAERGGTPGRNRPAGAGLCPRPLARPFRSQRLAAGVAEPPFRRKLFLGKGRFESRAEFKGSKETRDTEGRVRETPVRSDSYRGAGAHWGTAPGRGVSWHWRSDCSFSEVWPSRPGPLGNVPVGDRGKSKSAAVSATHTETRGQTSRSGGEKEHAGPPRSGLPAPVGGQALVAPLRLLILPC